MQITQDAGVPVRLDGKGRCGRVEILGFLPEFSGKQVVLAYPPDDPGGRADLHLIAVTTHDAEGFAKVCGGDGRSYLSRGAPDGDFAIGRIGRFDRGLGAMEVEIGGDRDHRDDNEANQNLPHESLLNSSRVNRFYTNDPAGALTGREKRG